MEKVKMIVEATGLGMAVIDSFERHLLEYPILSKWFHERFEIIIFTPTMSSMKTPIGDILNADRQIRV